MLALSAEARAFLIDRVATQPAAFPQLAMAARMRYIVRYRTQIRPLHQARWHRPRRGLIRERGVRNGQSMIPFNFRTKARETGGRGFVARGRSDQRRASRCKRPGEPPRPRRPPSSGAAARDQCHIRRPHDLPLRRNARSNLVQNRCHLFWMVDDRSA